MGTLAVAALVLELVVISRTSALTLNMAGTLAISVALHIVERKLFDGHLDREDTVNVRASEGPAITYTATLRMAHRPITSHSQVMGYTLCLAGALWYAYTTLAPSAAQPPPYGQINARHSHEAHEAWATVGHHAHRTNR